MKYVNNGLVHHTYMCMMFKSIFCVFSYFHALLLYWLSYFPHIGPHIAHSSGNMLLEVLQCCRFWFLMNLNRFLLLTEVKSCIADSGLPFSMEVNFGINSPWHFIEVAGYISENRPHLSPNIKHLFRVLVSLSELMNTKWQIQASAEFGNHLVPDWTEHSPACSWLPGWPRWLATRVAWTTTGHCQANWISSKCDCWA